MPASNAILISDSLAVKHRPKKFEDLIGNQAAKAILKGMLNNKRFPNAILIHGGSGKGKTTCARLIARYINCTTGTACGTCPSCRADSASPDVVELNMAETRGIDDIRNLIGKSRIAPRFNQRIFVLDEVHQLTGAAASALLKPLEDPPQKTMWILCTTNPEKLLKTIVGRCQQIEVLSPTEREVTEFLIKTSKLEGHKVTKENLPIYKQIATMSMGHTRNALQMLESLIAIQSSGEEIDVELAIRQIVRSSEDDLDILASSLLAAILNGKAKDALKIFYQSGQNSSIRGLMYKLRWFVDFKLNQWAGLMKFNPPINIKFETMFKGKINPIHLNSILKSIVEVEFKMNTLSGADERVILSSWLLDDLIKIVADKSREE